MTATLDNATILCSTPSISCLSPGCAVNFSVSLNSQDFSYASRFSAYDPPVLLSASPATSSFASHAVVLLNWTNVRPSSHAICKFGELHSSSLWDAAAMQWHGHAFSPFDSLTQSCLPVPARHTGLDTVTSSNFTDAPHGASLSGSAVINRMQPGLHGTLILTALPRDVGTLLLDPPKDSARPGSFTASFQWKPPEKQYHGLSFVYGPNVSRDAFGVEGSGDGLRVSFTGVSQPFIRISFQHEVHLEVRYPRVNQTTSLLRNVHIAYEPGYGLRMIIDGILVADRLTLHPWSPSLNWTFGFGATANDPNPRHEVLQTKLIVGDARWSHHRNLRLSLNGQQFTNAVPITYAALPVLHTMSPSSGPRSGNTSMVVSGANLQRGTQYTCRFGHLGDVVAQYENDSALSCQSPASLSTYSETVPLEVSLDNVSYTASGLLFQYTSESLPLALLPDRGSTAGGGVCVIQGDDLHGGSNYTCMFGLAVVPGTYDIIRDEIRCVAPSSSVAGAFPVRVSLNAQQYIDAGSYDFHAPVTIRSIDPISGPARGETVMHIAAYPTMPSIGGGACQFDAWRNISTDGASENQTLCITPPAVSTCALSSITEDFSIPSSKAPTPFQVQWLGGAELRHGALYMANSLMYDSSTIFHSPRCAFDDQTVPFRFEMYFVAGRNCRGISFCVGDLPEQTFDEKGSGSGLIVRLGHDGTVRVHYSGVLLWQTALSHDSCQSGTITFEVDAAMLTLTCNEYNVIDRLPIFSWEPKAGWRFGVGVGHDGMDETKIDDVKIDIGAKWRSGMASVRVSNNAQQFSEAAVPFSFYAEPKVSRLLFERGPVAGGTSVAVKGSSFRGGSVYVCRFGAQDVNATYDSYHDELRCVTPPAQAGGSVVEVSLNGQQYTSSRIVFEYYSEANVSHIVPFAGPLQGGTAITMFGAGFSYGRDYRCRFGTLSPAVVVATYVSDGQLACSTPAPRCGPGACEETVEVSLNSESFSASGVTFTYHNATVTSLSVVSGPSSGGTALTVHGSGFMQMPRVETVCRFGHGTVVASYIDEMRLLCVSPPADAAGASGAVSLDFAQHNEAMSLFAQPASAVQLAHGMLRLTAADMLQTGTALVAVPLLNETSEFEVSFNVFIGGGSGGEGVSFNVGALPSAQFGERGVSAALSVQLITAMRRVEVWHAHALLAQSVGELSLRQDRFVPVVITYGEEGLSVSFDGARVIENVTLATWNPDSSWKMGFGARTGETEHDIHAIDSVQIRTGAGFRKRPVSMEVSINGQEYTEAAVPFSFYAEPKVSRLLFERGPVAGGTSVAVKGSSFRGGSVYVCRFGAQDVNATYDSYHDELRCVTPPAQAGGSVVEVSLNGQQYTSSRIVFEYYSEANVSHIVPFAGPLQGGTAITMFGAGFSYGRDYRCRFGTLSPAVVVATYVSDGQLACSTPAPRCGPGACEETVEVSLNSESFSASGVTFTYHNATVTSLSVVSGPSSGGTALTVHGSGFMQMPRVETVCRFGHGTVVASYIDEMRLLCASPPEHKAGVSLLRERDLATTAVIAPTTHLDLLPLVSSAMLRVTPPDENRIRDGYLYSLPTTARTFDSLAVSFLARAPQPSTTSGGRISFCAGQDLTMFATNGRLDGFCVALAHELDSSRLTVEERGVVVASTLVETTFGAWIDVEVILTNATVSVTYDGLVVVRRAKLPSWVPSDNFELSFTARRGAVLPDGYRWLDGIRVLSGSLLASAALAVEVALNGQQFSSDGIEFTYLGEPNLRAIAPLAGPVSGNTTVELSVKAPSAFTNARSLVCAFNGAEVNGTWLAKDAVVRCLTPASVAGAGQASVVLSMTVDGHRLTSGDGVMFTYYAAPELLQVIPNSGPVDGNTDVVVVGLGFAAGLGPFACRYGTDVLPASAELRSDSLRCRTPSSTARTTTVDVTLNGQQYHQHEVVTFDAYPSPQVLSVSPASGTIQGETMVTIAGNSFVSSFANLCRWGNVTTKISSLNSTHIVCPSPRIGVGMRPLEVSMNGQQFTSDGHNFSFYLHPHVERLSVPGRQGDLGTWTEDKVTMPQAGFILVRVWGSGFMGGTDYRCRINEHEPITATYDESMDCILCWSDLWKGSSDPRGAGENLVEVTLNGREYTTDNISIPIKFFW